MAFKEINSSTKQALGKEIYSPLCCSSLLWNLCRLQALLALAEQESALEPINHNAAKIRVSLYADDAIVFLNPVKEDVQLVLEIFEVFGQASGLNINLDKSAVYPIRCENLNLEDILQPLNCQVKSFSCNYIGLPLSVRKL